MASMCLEMEQKLNEMPALCIWYSKRNPTEDIPSSLCPDVTFPFDFDFDFTD
jgi:hypothetical protein